MGTKISASAINLIVEFEVTSKAYYEKNYQKPEWPGLNSGVTVGIGYDLGYNTPAEIQSDWNGVVSAATIKAMTKYSGVVRAAAKAALPQARKEISIPWDAAMKVFNERTMPKWIKIVEGKLPNTDKLHPDCLGALVSMAYNMGPAFDDTRPKYKEMRNIKAHMKSGAFHKIPAEILSSKRNWPGVKGLLRRRDAEAALFLKGLATPIPTPVPDVEPVVAPKMDATKPLTSIFNKLKSFWR